MDHPKAAKKNRDNFAIKLTLTDSNLASGEAVPMLNDHRGKSH